jgi:hypothetical protein
MTDPTVAVDASSIMPLPKFQMRSSASQELIDEYRSKIADGIDLGPIDVWNVPGDGQSSRYAVLDGFHRFAALRATSRNLITVRIHDGTEAEALEWVLTKANIHGVRLTTEEQIEKVRIYASMHKKASQRDIAKACNVTRYIVSKALAQDEIEPDAPDDGEDHDGRDDEGAQSPESETPPGPEDSHGDADPADTAGEPRAPGHPVLDEIRVSREATNAAISSARDLLSNLEIMTKSAGQSAFLGTMGAKYASRVSEMIDNFRASMLVGACPACTGIKKRTTCKVCLDHGVVTKSTYESMTPAQQKKTVEVTDDLLAPKPEVHTNGKW